jgi:cell division protein ZapA
MAEVNLMIDGRTYGIACDDGQERRVQQLGAYIDQRLREIAGGGAGAGNKAQLMVLTALLLADEVFDLRDGLHQVANANEQLKNEPKQIFYQGLPPKEEKELIDAMGKMEGRIKKMAARAQKA